MRKTMVPRQDRSSLRIHTVPTTENRARQANFGANHTTRWKSPSARTYVELALKGALTHEQMRQAFKMGKINRTQFKQAFWKWFDPEGPLTVETIGIIRRFSPVLV